jgi:hypothetical protein
MRQFGGGMIAVLAVAGLACGSGSETVGTAGDIVVQGGGGQSALVTSVLQPYVVLVRDQNGSPESGVTVSWRVASGGGSVAPASSVTDGAGLAQATATLGTVAGVQVVQARAPHRAGSPVSLSSTGIGGPATQLIKFGGDLQSAPKAQSLAQPLVVQVKDAYNNPVGGATVTWAVTQGGGTVSAPSSQTTSVGSASVTWTLGLAAGPNTVTATVAGAGTATFTATALGTFAVLGGGNNVPERYSSDLWVANGYAYTGTWNWGTRTAGAQIAVVKVFQLSPSGAPVLVDSVVIAGGITVSDVEVSSDNQWLVFTVEGNTTATVKSGIYAYSLTDPAHPVFAAFSPVGGGGNGSGLHTGSLSVIGGKLYGFGAKNPPSTGSPALIIFDLSDVANGNITVASTTPEPANYGIHDTFVRDGICFAFIWNSGISAYDVGNGVKGGTPQNPQFISNVVTAGGEAHNGWWFWNQTNGQKRYLFVGQEGPASIGSGSSGDIHVVDVSNLNAPVEVATYSMTGAGTHNFWVDENRQVLYAAYYNGGVVALDVSGTLSGNLASREISRIKPGGAGNTFTWGVQLSGGYLYAIDMLSGLWQLDVP